MAFFFIISYVDAFKNEFAVRKKSGLALMKFGAIGVNAGLAPKRITVAITPLVSNVNGVR